MNEKGNSLDGLLKLIVEFFISPGLPEKRDKNYIKILIFLVIFVLLINGLYYMFK